MLVYQRVYGIYGIYGIYDIYDMIFMIFMMFPTAKWRVLAGKIIYQ
jgi:hypothetical protein